MKIALIVAAMVTLSGCGVLANLERVQQNQTAIDTRLDEFRGFVTRELAEAEAGAKTRDEAISSIDREKDKVADAVADLHEATDREIELASKKIEEAIVAAKTAAESGVTLTEALTGAGGLSALATIALNAYRNSSRRRDLEIVEGRATRQAVQG